MKTNQIKLSFSGGGFRASFYCLGAYRRLVELGLHPIVTHISSVSGGSITAGAIMYALSNSPFTGLEDFDQRVTSPMKSLGQVNFRNQLLKTAFSPFRLKNYIPETPKKRFTRIFPNLLDKHIFKNKLMKDLPKSPEWSCNATCLNTLKRFRFKPSDMYGFELGYCKDMEGISIALAVASSAAFPLMFAPLRLNIENKYFDNKYSKTKFNYKTLLLTDGGVYDNLGSENLLKEDIPFIIIDASSVSSPWPDNLQLKSYKHIWRILSVSLEQIILLRRRLIYQHPNKNCIQLILSKSINDLVDFETEYRKPDRPFPVFSNISPEVELLIAGLRTDLDFFHNIEIDLLMWAGEIRMDLAIKSLFPHLINNDLWITTPKSPDYPLDMILNKLNQGQKRMIFRT
ncbi:patatin-like phospholipase family protein [Brevibacillus sp. NPDC058079]|uniref:patatin-like phospholipase family protein n=1 Tax=Brevibacillus sp. NPDC058079 TaxID=3346330 RepID=UPI0036E064A1